MRTRAIIHLDRFLSNFNAVKGQIGQRKICVPVKADAYGHGAAQIAKASIEAGAHCLGVAAVAEGLELRNEGISAPILLFSQPNFDDIPGLIANRLIPFVSDEWYASALNKQAEAEKIKLPVHIKIDTGMGRMGCSADEAPALARHIASCPGLELAGTATHFACSDSQDAGDIEYTKQQLEKFNKAINLFREAGINPGIIHAANSGALVLHKESWFDMVRPGIFLYGYNTAEKKETLKAQPVMELRSPVTLLKKIKKGESVSYGRTWTAPQDTVLGVLPVGYADGLPRLVSGNWKVEIDGKFYPVVGRICMDICCVDLGPQPAVKRWDDAVIIGNHAENNAAELAHRTGMIPYEITCNVGHRVEREYKR